MNHQQHASRPGQGSPDEGSRGRPRATRDPGSDAAASGRANRGGEPSLPHELDESARSQASATPRHAEIGKRAMADELGPSEDTDRGPVMDKVYHEQVATDRGHTPPRR